MRSVVLLKAFSKRLHNFVATYYKKKNLITYECSRFR